MNQNNYRENFSAGQNQWQDHAKTEYGSEPYSKPFTPRDQNASPDQHDIDGPEKDMNKNKKRGMSRLRSRRGPGRSGKLTKSGLDMQSFYKTKICPYLLAGHCTKGEKCSFAHSQTELRDTPNLKKTKVCQQYGLGKCQMGAKCSYAHGEEELRYTPEFYKTSLCKAFEQGNCKMDDRCRYAHGEEDLRAPTILEDQTVTLPRQDMMIPPQMQNLGGMGMMQGFGGMPGMGQQMQGFGMPQAGVKLESQMNMQPHADILNSFNMVSLAGPTSGGYNQKPTNSSS